MFLFTSRKRRNLLQLWNLNPPLGSEGANSGHMTAPGPVAMPRMDWFRLIIWCEIVVGELTIIPSSLWKNKRKHREWNIANWIYLVQFVHNCLFLNECFSKSGSHPISTEVLKVWSRLLVSLRPFQRAHKVKTVVIRILRHHFPVLLSFPPKWTLEFSRGSRMHDDAVALSSGGVWLCVFLCLKNLIFHF